jgi:hypothetical protein
MNTLPEGSTRDGAVIVLISSIGQSDPATAYSWAVTLSDPVARNTYVVNLTMQWSPKNPAAAAAAAQSALGSLTDLSPAQQAILQQIVNNAPP